MCQRIAARLPRARPLLAIFALALLESLVSADADAQAPTVRDSAGVQVVEDRARKDAPIAFRLGDRPLLQVGGDEAEPHLEFEHNQGYLRATRLSDGRLVVIDVTRLHFFSPDGRRLAIVGRQGDALGDHQYLMGICRTYPSDDAWTAFDSTGRMIGRLVIRARMERVPRTQVIEFGRDHVVLRRFDSNRFSYRMVVPLVSP